LDTPEGRIAVGWLIVEDLVMVLTLVLLPAFAGHLGGATNAHNAHTIRKTVSGLSLGLTLGKSCIVVALMLSSAGAFSRGCCGESSNTGSRELFTLAVVALALGVAFGSARLFRRFIRPGRVFCRVVINESELSHRAASGLQSLQDAFGVLFFVAVGMLFDPRILV